MGYQGVMKRFWILAAAISSTFFTTLAIPAPSVEAGATKAATCQACHGANGNSTNPEWPSLAGLGADYIAEQVQTKVLDAGIDGVIINMPFYTPGVVTAAAEALRPLVGL